MISAIDRIVIAVPDIAEAAVQYGVLLGAEFWWPGGNTEQLRAWLGLANVVIELRELPVALPTITAIVFADESAPPGEQSIQNARALLLHTCDGSETAAFRRVCSASQNSGLAVDHLVLHSSDADACIQLFSVGLGLRLALDKQAPQWGGRMLFFRLGKLTLEVIELAEREAGPDHFWGIAFSTPDISAMVGQVVAGGVEMSAVRPGRKPGTKVATIKSHALGIPTLLIEPAAVA